MAYRDLNDIHQPQNSTQPPFPWFTQVGENQAFFAEGQPLVACNNEGFGTVFLDSALVPMTQVYIDQSGLITVGYLGSSSGYSSVPNQTEVEITLTGIYYVTFAVWSGGDVGEGSHRGCSVELESAGTIAEAFAPGDYVAVQCSAMWPIEAGDVLSWRILHDGGATIGAVGKLQIIFMGGYRNDLQPLA